MKKTHFAAVLAALAVQVAALANTTEEVRAGGAAFIPSLGLSIDAVGNSTMAEHTRTSHSIDMGFSYAHARRKQTHDLGDGPINFGGTTFVGQQDINWTSNIQLAHLGYKPRIWFGQSNFALEGVFGVGWAGLGIKGVGALGQSASERMSNGGFVAGAGGIWRFASATSLQVRFLNFVSGSKEGVTAAGRSDVTVTHALGKNVQLRGGLGTISAYSAREDAESGVFKSPIHASGTGLLLGLDILF
jgi:hypothetical protein